MWLRALASFCGQGQHLLHSRRVGNVAHHLLVGAGADLLLHFHAHGLQVEAQFLKDIDGHALAQLDQPEQEVFGADEVVVETVGFFARQREHLLRARREIVHGFLIAHTHYSKCNHFCRFVQSGARRRWRLGRRAG